jgi:hypothetical protein
VLVGGVIDDQVHDHPDSAVPSGTDCFYKVAVRAQTWVNTVEIGDVVSVVTVRSRIERHQPQAGDAEFFEVVDPLRQSGQVTDAVCVPVDESLDVETIDDSGLPPQVCGIRDPHAGVYQVWFRFAF